MSSGESDAVRFITVDNTNPPGDNYYSPSVTGPKSNYWYYDWPNTSNNFTWTYNHTIYKYQIKCPATKCKKMNWLELDKITPCVNCGMKLKAVSEQADFEVEVTA